MCGASLANPTLSNHSSISDMLHTSQQQQQQPLEDDAHVRIAFRNGGLSGFVSKLKEAVDVKAWNNKVCVIYLHLIAIANAYCISL